MQLSHYIGEPQRSFTGERKSKFDDKDATATIMKYDAKAKLECSKSTRSYLISKAFEMYHLLNWAENFQSTIISNRYIQRLTDDRFCFDSDPMQLSADLWGYLNLSTAGATDKEAFDNALPRNGFDAWRRIVRPLGARSKHDYTTCTRTLHVPRPRAGWRM